jgi:hypothetical protein
MCIKIQLGQLLPERFISYRGIAQLHVPGKDWGLQPWLYIQIESTLLYQIVPEDVRDLARRCTAIN